MIKVTTIYISIMRVAAINYDHNSLSVAKKTFQIHGSYNLLQWSTNNKHAQYNTHVQVIQESIILALKTHVIIFSNNNLIFHMKRHAQSNRCGANIISLECKYQIEAKYRDWLQIFNCNKECHTGRASVY